MRHVGMNEWIPMILPALAVAGICAAVAPTPYNENRKNPLETIVLEPG